MKTVFASCGLMLILLVIAGRHRTREENFASSPAVDAKTASSNAMTNRQAPIIDSAPTIPAHSGRNTGLGSWPSSSGAAESEPEGLKSGKASTGGQDVRMAEIAMPPSVHRTAGTLVPKQRLLVAWDEFFAQREMELVKSFRDGGITPEWEAAADELMDAQAVARDQFLEPTEIEVLEAMESDEMEDVRSATSWMDLADDESLQVVRKMKEWREKLAGVSTEGDEQEVSLLEPDQLLQAALRAVLGDTRYNEWTNRVHNADGSKSESVSSVDP